ncbi:MAG TPA: P22 phage major capsid protein family protein [Nocardioides sp.]
MPNEFITPEVIAARALATLYNNTVLLPLVHRDFQDDFSGKQGDTVTVRVPLVFEAKEYDRDTGIEIQDATQDRFPVSLDKIVDVSFEVTSEEMLLEIDDFDETLLSPAMEAISQKVDFDLATELVAAARQNGNPSGDYVQKQDGGGVVESADPDHPAKVLIAARTVLGRAKMPLLNRRAVVSPEGAGELLGDALLHEADKRGDTDGLIEAAIGRKFGFDSYETQVLGEGATDVGAVDGLGFHRDAVTIATRLLPQPLGKRDGTAASKSYKGLGLRVVYGYDMDRKSDVVSIDTLYGTRAVRPQGCVELDLGQGS